MIQGRKKVGASITPTLAHGTTRDMGPSRTRSRPKDPLRHYDVIDHDVMFQKLTNENAGKWMTSREAKSINRRTF